MAASGAGDRGSDAEWSFVARMSAATSGTAGWRRGRARSHSAPEKSYRNCELAHRRRRPCLIICRPMAPRAHALPCAPGASAFRKYWVIAMGVFHRTAMLCSWFIESTMSGCTERFRVR